MQGSPSSALTQIPRNIVRSETLFIPPYHNDESLPSKCKKLGITCYRGRYSGVSDLKGFLSILHIPYAWSNLALFEMWAAGHVFVIPTLEFLRKISTEINFFWSPPLDWDDISLSEWYDPSHSPLFVFFDSWQELRSVVMRREFRELLQEKQSYINTFIEGHSWAQVMLWREQLLTLQPQMKQSWGHFKATSKEPSEEILKGGRGISRRI